MKIIVALPICVLYCVVSIGSGETCFRSEILRKRLEYRNGGDAHTLFVNAIKDFASYLRVEIDNNIIPKPDSDVCYVDIYEKLDFE
uniref:Secreted protein n=1 Tax=Angiostrongylus cantonensis TaxID=6313 RepID=A0A0K0D4D4_ANGCA